MDKLYETNLSDNEGLDITDIRIGVIKDSIEKAKNEFSSYTLLLFIFLMFLVILNSDSTFVYAIAIITIATIDQEEFIFNNSIAILVLYLCFVLAVSFIPTLPDYLILPVLITVIIIGIIKLAVNIFNYQKTLIILDGINKVTLDQKEDFVASIYNKIIENNSEYKIIKQKAKLDRNWIRKMFGKEPIQEPSTLMIAHINPKLEIILIVILSVIALIGLTIIINPLK